eukprot:COSAG01_NODE_3738_length_5746_cov_133.642642_3_plen_66_part_00
MYNHTVQRRANDFELGEAQRRADFEVTTQYVNHTFFLWIWLPLEPGHHWFEHQLIVGERSGIIKK